MLVLPIIALRANGNDTEILEFKLNDFYSIKLRQISESEYTDQKKETVRHKPYKVITDIAEAQKMLGTRIKGVGELQEFTGYSYYNDLEVIHKGGVKKLHNVIWFGWDSKFPNLIAYYPEVEVLILNHAADGEFPIDLNNSDNVYVGNPKYYAFSPDMQFRINGYFPGGAADGVTYWLEKWNKSKKKYEFIEYFGEANNYYRYFCFNCITEWFWTSNSKVLFKHWESDIRYYGMELIEK
jgi:hypothetical protein